MPTALLNQANLSFLGTEKWVYSYHLALPAGINLLTMYFVSSQHVILQTPAHVLNQYDYYRNDLNRERFLKQITHLHRVALLYTSLITCTLKMMKLLILAAVLVTGE